MTQIKIEVPANDHIALSAMADALQRIATERAPQELTPSEMGDPNTATGEGLKVLVDLHGVTPNVTVGGEYYGSNTDQLNDELEHASQPVVDVELARLDEELEESIHHENTKHDEAFEEAVDSTLDADGIPHDKRIHSKGATRLADNTWRLRKRPADKTEEEWTTYIDSVKAELKTVQDIPSVEADELPAISIEDITKAEINAGMLDELTPPSIDEQADELNDLQIAILNESTPVTPPVIEEPATQLEGVTPNGDVAIEPPVTVGAPVAPVTPPTSLTPPTVEASSGPKVTTFQELMLYMTSDAKKRGADNDMIKATLLEVDPALTAIPLIATRVDLIPKFVTALEAKLS